jgi:hypothetical protein
VTGLDELFLKAVLCRFRRYHPPSTETASAAEFAWGR